MAGSKMLKWMGLEAEKIDAADVRQGRLASYDLILFPNGNMYAYTTGLKGTGYESIEEYVKTGGALILIGGSAVLLDDTFGIKPMATLSLLPGPTVPVDSEVQWPFSRKTMVGVAVTNNSHPINSGMPDSFLSLRTSGDPVYRRNRYADITVLARYEDTDEIAMLALEYGRGRVFAIGVSAEHEENSYRDGFAPSHKLYDPDSEWELMKKAAAWAMGDAGSSGRRVLKSYIRTAAIASLIAYLVFWIIYLIRKRTRAASKKHQNEIRSAQ